MHDVVTKIKVRSRRILNSIFIFFFTKKITLIKWQLNVFTVSVLGLGILIGGAGILPKLMALNETNFTIAQGGDSNFTLGTTVNTTATASNITLAKDANWYSLNWNYKKPLTIKNNSSATLNANSSMTISVDTSSLESVLANCNDIRIVYQTNTVLPITISRELGSTGCNDSKVTNFTFPIQANLTTGSSDSTNYALYYGNNSASAQGSNGYSIQGGPTATMTCSFNGSSTCETGQTPTTETGAIRYFTKSGLSFDEMNDSLTLGGNNTPANSTYELWYFPKKYGSAYGAWARLLNSPTTVLGIYNPGTIVLRTNSCAGDVTGNGASLNTWNHIAMTFDGSTYKVYLNGQLIITKACSSATTYNTASTIGFVGTDPLAGIIDEVRVSNNVRYTNTFTPTTSSFISDSNTLVLYHLDENGDDPRNAGKAIDASGNGNHGTISGAKYVGGIVGVDSSSADSGKISNQSYASHSGVLVEEGTTNLITNPSFEHSTYNTNWSTNYMTYASGSSTFTPNVGKRTSPSGPFASSVLLQGKLGTNATSDSLSVSTGSQISGNFYQNFDATVGTILFWITPEWNGNDNNTHTFVYGNGNRYLFQKTSGNSIQFYDGAVNYISGPSTTSWVAGNTYLVAVSWDSNNKIDGTNYVRFTVNNANTFAANSFTPSATSTILLNDRGGNGNDALIQGLTIYRRVLFDGTYGTDVGNGNELTQIYNSGTGKDPTAITGSWDVVFALPTNGSTGTLGTTGEAWSHPYTSNKLGGTNGKNGFMTDGTYTNDGWDKNTWYLQGGVATANVLAAYQAQGVSSQANSYVNLANPGTYDLTAGVAPAWASNTGWTFNGTSQYLKNGLTLASNYTVIYQFVSGSQGSSYRQAFGYYTSGTDQYILSPTHQTGGNQHLFAAGSGGYTASPALSSGVIAAAGTQFYLNGAAEGSAITPGGTVGTEGYIGAVRGVGGFSVNNWTGSIGAFVIYNTTLTAQQVAAVSAAMNNVTSYGQKDVSVSALATNEKIYSGGYKWTSSSANQGIIQKVTGQTTSSSYVVRPVVHYDSTSIPKVQILDATNGDALITSITAPDQSANQLTNGTFNTDTSSWSGGLSASLSSVAGGQSGNALQVQNGAANFGYALQTPQLVPNATYRLSFYTKNGTGTGTQVYVNADSVGGTQIGTSGSKAAASWTQYSFTFTTTNTGLVAVRLNLNQNTSGLTGFFDEIVLTRVIDISHPWTDSFAFQLPTISRNGSTADSTSFKVTISNTASSGITYVDQIEVLPNLLDNPSFEFGSGSPYIPTGWSNSGYAAGNTSTTAGRTGTYAMSTTLPGSGSLAGFAQAPTVTAGNYYALDFWTKRVSSSRVTNGYNASGFAHTYYGSKIDGLWDSMVNTNAWSHYSSSLRAQGTSGRISFENFTNSGTFDIDDVSLYALNSVTLSLTPSSLANSTETSGVRVDGADTLTQPVSNLSATSGVVKFKYTPRHNAADMLKYGVSTPYIIDLYGDANNYIRAYWSYANQVTFVVNDGTGERIKSWDATGAIVAGTTYNLEISYSSTQILFKVDGVTKIDMTQVANWWTAGSSTGALVAYQPKGASSLANSYVNKVNPGTNDASLGIAPTWDVNNGWTFDGSTQYLKTGIIPATGQTMIARFNYTTGINSYIAGGSLGTESSIGLSPNRSGTTVWYAMGTPGVLGLNPQLNAGNLAIAGTVAYRNGMQETGTVPTFSGTSTKEFYLGGYNNNGSMGGGLNGKIQALSIYSGTLTPAQVSAVVGAMDMVVPLSFTTVPTTVYFGSKQDGTSQADATYSNFTSLTSSQNTTAPYIKFGSNSVKLINGGTLGDEYTTSTNPASTLTHTFSGYVYDGTTGNVGGIVNNTIAELYYNNTTISTTYTDMGGGWWRLNGSLVGINQSDNFGVQVKSGKTIYIDGFQLERDVVGGYRSGNRTYATTYIDGSLGTGYSWSGTANNSTSTRAGGQGGTLTYSPTNNISASQGSVSFWLKRLYIDTDDKGWGITAGYLTTHNSGEGSNDLSVFSLGSTLRCYGWWGASDTVTTVGQWYNIVVTWDATANARKCYINNVQKGTTTGGNITIETLKVGQSSNWGAVYPSDGIISDFRVFNQALNVNQVSDIYNQGLGIHSQASTNQQKYATSGTWESPIINLTSNASWGMVPNFVTTDSANGNTITYDMKSSPDGISWGAYTANSGSSPNYIINAAAQKYIQVTANLASGTQITTPQVNSMSIHYVQDTTPPTVNAANTIMKVNASGSTVTKSTGWANDPSPYFQWDLAQDNVGGSGIKGYCLSLSQTSSDNPATQKGLLGSSPISTNGTTCQFIVGTNQIDFSNSSYKGNTWLSASNSKYYLNIKAIDNTGNIYPTSETFDFYYDDVPPTNVTSFSTPQNSFANVGDIYFNWPTSGAGIASDSTSGLLGYQYSLNNETNWTGSDTDPTLGVKYIPVGHSQPYYLSAGTDGPSIQQGNNTIYFRALDTAGNRSSISRTALISYGGDAPKFADGSSITITPLTSSTNSYAVSWPSVTPAVGRTFKSYYYMVNTTPPNLLSTILSNSSIYIPTTSTSIPEGKLVGAVKGSNTISVVAIDDLNNYSASNALTQSFTLNSTLPDPALNLRAADTSIKSVSLWSVSLAWEAPVYKGTGTLSYEIDRSENGTTWTKVSETNGTAFVDTVPLSKKYYYRVGSMDTTDESKASPSYSLSVNITPKGSYTVPAPLVSNPVVSNITTRRATITWVTARSADSRISFGIESGKYFTDEIANSTQVTTHTNTLTSLLPSTTYYYKAIWTDEDGNVGTSNEQTFVTDPAPSVKDITVKYIGTSSAQIQFTSVGASKIRIYYGTTTKFGSLQELETSVNETKYTILIDNLTDGTKYYYKIDPFDSEFTEYEGSILDFTTLPNPRVSDVKLQQIKNTAETSILVTWASNTEVTSIVTYYPENKINLSRDSVNINLEKGAHKITLTGLLPDTTYNLVVKGVDRIGNEARSDIIKFTTATDTRAPSISEVSVEASPSDVTDTVSGKKTTQIIVSWKTDEPASSRVEYGENTGDVYNYKTPEDNNLKTDHVVIISNLSASQIYHLRAISSDKAGNEDKSVDQVSITPNPNDNALDLIVKNLRNIFGF
ncbi:MAG: LamG-like jellyroll fold domain-containing protein [bacterium]